MIEPSQLQNYSFFGGLLEAQIQKILPFLEKESYESGDDIIVEGTPNDKIRFIIDGRVAVLKHSVILQELGEGDTFGEMEVLDVMPCVATIKALSGTTVFSMSNRGLREIYHNDVQCFSLIIMNLARDLSRRLRHLDDKLVDTIGEKEQDLQLFT